jgi:hypothetical protein
MLFILSNGRPRPLPGDSVNSGTLPFHKGWQSLEVAKRQTAG